MKVVDANCQLSTNTETVLLHRKTEYGNLLSDRQNLNFNNDNLRNIQKKKKKKKKKKGKRKVQGVPQLQTAALPRHQEE